MIQRLSLRNNEAIWLLDFLNKNSDYDFYFTSENVRIYISDLASLKKLLKNSICVYVKKSRDEYQGIILVWKSVGGGVSRYYVKTIANDAHTAKELLTVLLWNCNKELFIKIRKDNRFVNVFKDKGFRFINDRGVQVLLNRKPMIYQKVFKKEEAACPT